MEFNDAIIAVENIICPKPNTPRRGWTSGFGMTEINGKSYCITNIFNSNRSQCYKDVIAYLNTHKIPHLVEQTDRQWPGTKVFKQYDITILVKREN